MDGTSEAYLLFFKFCPQLVLVGRVRAHLYPDGQSSNIAYMSLSQRIYKLYSRLDICCRPLRVLNHIMRTALRAMGSPVLLRKIPRQRPQPHLQSRSRYATSAH